MLKNAPCVQRYSELLRYARHVTRKADEAEDLLQNVLLAAVEAGRADMQNADNRRWLMGALRKRALFDARSAVRRKARETRVASIENASRENASVPVHFISSLSAGLRTTALLALTGHTKAEIAWLLRLSDCALRQRISVIRRHWRKAEGHDIYGIPGLAGGLHFGRIRQALIKPVNRADAALASHDPDGHLFILASQNRLVRQQKNMFTIKKECPDVQ